ncbi:hypothetical protein IFDJLNFL_5798 [Methylobacterium dankookense]|uniref:Uncharacterized protein n=1 Tax=Methylobacterium dankookense TaxID=560405 RepID=A0ABQ4RR50_9HYPH|nr:hypothetical protein IFDJLNFL_5798 [Methylobacterium dankookense]
MEHVRALLGRPEGLRIGRAERDQPGLETVPDAGIGVGVLKVHGSERRDALQIGQGRHVHDREAGQLRLGDLDHQHADRVVGVLRLLHGEADEVVAGDVHVLRRHRVELARQVARMDRPVLGLVAQLDPDFRALAVDQVGRLLPADQGHVVPGHQKLRPEQGAVGSAQDQDVACHAVSPLIGLGLVIDRRRAFACPARIAGEVALSGRGRPRASSYSLAMMYTKHPLAWFGPHLKSAGTVGARGGREKPRPALRLGSGAPVRPARSAP